MEAGTPAPGVGGAGPPEAPPGPVAASPRTPVLTSLCHRRLFKGPAPNTATLWDPGRQDSNTGIRGHSSPRANVPVKHTLLS